MNLTSSLVAEPVPQDRRLDRTERCPVFLLSTAGRDVQYAAKSGRSGLTMLSVTALLSSSF